MGNYVPLPFLISAILSLSLSYSSLPLYVSLYTCLTHTRTYTHTITLATHIHTRAHTRTPNYNYIGYAHPRTHSQFLSFILGSFFLNSFIFYHVSTPRLSVVVTYAHSPGYGGHHHCHRPPVRSLQPPSQQTTRRHQEQ